jgi:hypothetical protein
MRLTSGRCPRWSREWFGIGLGFLPIVGANAQVLDVVNAMMWFMPDRRIEPISWGQTKIAPRRWALAGAATRQRTGQRV